MQLRVSWGSMTPRVQRRSLEAFPPSLADQRELGALASNLVNMASEALSLFQYEYEFNTSSLLISGLGMLFESTRF